MHFVEKVTLNSTLFSYENARFDFVITKTWLCNNVKEKIKLEKQEKSVLFLIS